MKKSKKRGCRQTTTYIDTHTGMYISHEVKECDTLGFELEMKLNRKDAVCTTILEHDYKLNSKL